MKAIIVGAGIGGLTAALAFHKFGWDVELLERTPEFGEIGAGIQISPNGMAVFRALGLEAAISARAFRPEALEMRLGRSGRSIFRVSIAEESETLWGAPYLHIHRADLADCLREAVENRLPGALKLSSDIVAYKQTGSSISAHAKDGTYSTGDILVGADGIHSAIRTQMLGSDAPDFTGNVAWRAVVPTDALGDLAPPPTACIWTGAGKHAVTYRLRAGTLCNFVGVVERSDWHSESWTERGEKADILADFEGWYPTLITMIEAASAHFRWALFDRQPLSQWSEGRAVLIGDACHPTLPFMAQGACMAIEDGFVLAGLCTENASDLPGTLQAFYKARIARTARIQAGSRRNMKTFHKRHPLSQLATYGPMWLAGQLAPSFIRNRQNWLYGHDVVG